VLKGAFVFLADLIRALTIPVRVDFIACSSYGTSTESSGVVKILKDLDYPVDNKHILLVEDIVDTGLTLSYIVSILKERHPLSLKICALLDKPERRVAPVELDYLGFIIPNEFVVGYGLDFNGHFRNLPFIGILKKEVYSKK
jgi:hypoxanthine phosphoribosyltransferase